ncbi:hypothetical protein IWX90DRAFT_318615 [Phyllosticta citrichinensis]|uniref:Uncharacterized protein n=1 Tax=Phyllosticta citrichinensis TaxID=1130410 RepID=A0ABR1XJA8_9PEZI
MALSSNAPALANPIWPAGPISQSKMRRCFATGKHRSPLCTVNFTSQSRSRNRLYLRLGVSFGEYMVDHFLATRFICPTLRGQIRKALESLTGEDHHLVEQGQPKKLDALPQLCGNSAPGCVLCLCQSLIAVPLPQMLATTLPDLPACLSATAEQRVRVADWAEGREREMTRRIPHLPTSDGEEDSPSSSVVSDEPLRGRCIRRRQNERGAPASHCPWGNCGYRGARQGPRSSKQLKERGHQRREQRNELR